MRMPSKEKKPNDEKPGNELDSLFAELLEQINDPVERILLEGRAHTVYEAEELYLNEELDNLPILILSPLTDEEFRNHPYVQLLLSHGSRPWEDSLK